MLRAEVHKDWLVVNEVYLKNLVISALATKTLMLMFRDTWKFWVKEFGFGFFTYLFFSFSIPEKKIYVFLFVDKSSKNYDIYYYFRKLAKGWQVANEVYIKNLVISALATKAQMPMFSDTWKFRVKEFGFLWRKTTILSQFMKWFVIVM